MSEDNIKIKREKELDLENLDKIMELIGELLINKSRLEALDIFKGEAKDILSQLDRVTMELHHNIMKVRMIPIELLFAKFYQKLDKLDKEQQEIDKEHIEIEIDAKDVKIDRNIAEKLEVPLLNYLENSLKVSASESDFSKNKAAEASVSAQKEGNEIKIFIEENWSKKAFDQIEIYLAENNIIEADSVQGLDLEEIHRLFSEHYDQESLDEAGSKVELSSFIENIDQLQDNIKNLNGGTKLKQAGEKVKIEITIPLTFAITQALMVEIKGDLFAIPVEHISETKRITTSEIKNVKNERVIVFREQSIPLIDSYDCLALKRDKNISEENEELEILILSSDHNPAALIVDELLNQQDIVFKSMGALLQNVENISGATIIGDGEIALILDVKDIV